MANGVLNTAHPNMQFNVQHSKKPRCSNCKKRINIYKSINGIHVPCYLGFWVEYHSRSLKHHKHWFCPNDLNHCVGGIVWNFAVAKLVVPIVWPIQESANLTQKDITTLKEVGFSFDRLRRNKIQSLFGFQSSSSNNSHVHAVSCHNLMKLWSYSMQVVGLQFVVARRWNGLLCSK
jgi:hypothetical protein